MNFVGHHEVARRAGLPAAGRLGAMLPDFATMLGVRLQRDPLDAHVLRGVDLHHETDAAFHAHRRVRAGMSELTADATAAGLSRGAARAIGHIGYEMILDSVVDDDMHATIRAAGHDDAISHALGNHPEWVVMRTHLMTRVAQYDDAEWVADRLFQILGRRPRLAFPPEALGAVRAVLGRRAPSIRETAHLTFHEVSEKVSRRAA